MSELTRRYQNELKRTRQLVASHVERQWRALPDVRDDRVQPFLNAVLPVVKAGQMRAVALTSAYMSQRLAMKSPVGLRENDLVGSAVRNGVDMAEVYTRPFITARAAIYTIGIAAALEKGLNRLRSTAEMDVAMSARDATLAFGNEVNSGGTRIVGWIRVADPACCDFCQMIDGAKTGPDEPQPLHNNCGCTADPIEIDTPAAEGIGDTNLSEGDVIDEVAIEAHGELGPVITNKHDDFTSFADLPTSYKADH